MKIKKISLIGLSILAFATASYAEEGKGYHIVSESIKSSPGFNGHITHDNVKKKLAGIITGVTADTYDRSGNVNQYIKVDSDHSVNIVNNTDYIQRYTYVYKLMCEQEYQEFDRTVDIDPHGNFSDQSHNYGVVQMGKPIQTHIIATTEISGAETDGDADEKILTVQ